MRMYSIVSAEALAKMGGNRGKLGTQIAHSILHAYWMAEERFPEAAAIYRSTEHGGVPRAAVKITLLAESDQVLRDLFVIYNEKCGATLVTDAGKTVFSEPTLTCLGLGPIDMSEIGEDLRILKVLI